MFTRANTYFAYKYVKIKRGILNKRMSMDPFAAEPKWYLTSLHMAVPTGESVGLRKYQNATAAASTNCWQARKQVLLLNLLEKLVKHIHTHTHILLAH